MTVSRPSDEELEHDFPVRVEDDPPVGVDRFAGSSVAPGRSVRFFRPLVWREVSGVRDENSTLARRRVRRKLVWSVRSGGRKRG